MYTPLGRFQSDKNRSPAPGECAEDEVPTESDGEMHTSPIVSEKQVRLTLKEMMNGNDKGRRKNRGTERPEDTSDSGYKTLGYGEGLRKTVVIR